jgi:hypothetical protein
MNITIENNVVIIHGTEEEFQPLVEASVISSKFIEGGGTFLLSNEISFSVVADVTSLLHIDLVTRFRALFPEGLSKQHGKSFRGNLGKVKDNLKEFKKKFKYTDEEILEATEAYIGRQIMLGKKDFIPQAHYFIKHQQRGSELETACESFKNGELTRSTGKWR